MSNRDAVASMLAYNSNTHFEEKSEYFKSSQMSEDEDQVVDKFHFDFDRSRAESEDRNTFTSKYKSSGIVPAPQNSKPVSRALSPAQTRTVKEYLPLSNPKSDAGSCDNLYLKMKMMDSNSSKNDSNSSIPRVANKVLNKANISTI